MVYERETTISRRFVPTLAQYPVKGTSAKWPISDIKQEAFVREYLLSGNASDAYRRAGYGAKDVDVAGPRLLGNVGIAAAIAEGRKKIVAKADADFDLRLDGILRKLAQIATVDRTKLTCAPAWSLSLLLRHRASLPMEDAPRVLRGRRATHAQERGLPGEPPRPRNGRRLRLPRHRAARNPIALNVMVSASATPSSPTPTT